MRMRRPRGSSKEGELWRRSCFYTKRKKANTGRDLHLFLYTQWILSFLRLSDKELPDILFLPPTLLRRTHDLNDRIRPFPLSNSLFRSSNSHGPLISPAAYLSFSPFFEILQAQDRPWTISSFWTIFLSARFICGPPTGRRWSSEDDSSSCTADSITAV